MIFGVLRGARDENALLEKQIRLEAAYCTDEQVAIATLFTEEELEIFC